jgi:hypothetical protein
VTVWPPSKEVEEMRGDADDAEGEARSPGTTGPQPPVTFCSLTAEPLTARAATDGGASGSRTPMARRATAA